MGERRKARCDNKRMCLTGRTAKQPARPSNDSLHARVPRGSTSEKTAQCFFSQVRTQMQITRELAPFAIHSAWKRLMSRGACRLRHPAAHIIDSKVIDLRQGIHSGCVHSMGFMSGVYKKFMPTPNEANHEDLVQLF